jgi:hypothetical protein
MPPEAATRIVRAEVRREVEAEFAKKLGIFSKLNPFRGALFKAMGRQRCSS